MLNIIIRITKKIQLKKIENVLKMWKMKQLTMQGRIKIFRSVSIFQIIYLALNNSISAEMFP